MAYLAHKIVKTFDQPDKVILPVEASLKKLQIEILVAPLIYKRKNKKLAVYLSDTRFLLKVK